MYEWSTMLAEAFLVFRWYERWVYAITQKMRLHDGEIKLHLGLWEPDLTAYAYGLAWAFFSQILTRTTLFADVDDVRLHIEPEFQSVLFTVDLGCILSFRFGDVIYVSVRSLWHYFRQRKESMA